MFVQALERQLYIGKNNMELYDAMSTLRAVRRLKPDPIPENVVNRILEAATWAPTGGNVQPWRMVAVTDADKKQVLEDLYRPRWESYIPGYESKMEKMPEASRASSARAALSRNWLTVSSCFAAARLIARASASSKEIVVRI